MKKNGDPDGPPDPPPLRVVAKTRDRVKAELLEAVGAGVDRLLNIAEAESTSPRVLEIQVWSELLAWGRLLLTHLFGLLCWKATCRDRNQRGFGPEHVRLRMDKDYWGTVMTTFGPVSFPFFAYRDASHGVATVTRNPARATVFPYHDRCRSSVLLLEWEARFGSGYPFRRAEEELAFFTRGSVTTEDNTIGRHIVRLGAMVDRSWLYRTPGQIREILRTQATRDAQSQKPIIYASSDAHAERRYVDDVSWSAPWKMVNGIRLWCEDGETGQTIHLGGEFTWGDCNDVRHAFERLIETGTLPADGDYGEGIVAQMVWISDAMLWFDEHILPLFPAAIVILDVHHLLRWFALFATVAFRAGTKPAQRLYRAAQEAIFGPKAQASHEPIPRRGHTKRKKASKKHTHDRPRDRRATHIQRQGEHLVNALLDILASLKLRGKKARQELDLFVNRLCKNVLRMGYKAYLARGFQIGSGAMESLHRTGCQLRTKIPGAKWLAETAQAIFDLRMLHLVGNWDAFWSQPDLLQQITGAFNKATRPKDVGAELMEAS